MSANDDPVPFDPDLLSLVIDPPISSNLSDCCVDVGLVDQEGTTTTVEACAASVVCSPAGAPTDCAEALCPSVGKSLPPWMLGLTDSPDWTITGCAAAAPAEFAEGVVCDDGVTLPPGSERVGDLFFFTNDGGGSLEVSGVGDEPSTVPFIGELGLSAGTCLEPGCEVDLTWLSVGLGATTGIGGMDVTAGDARLAGSATATITQRSGDLAWAQLQNPALVGSWALGLGGSSFVVDQLLESSGAVDLTFALAGRRIVAVSLDASFGDSSSGEVTIAGACGELIERAPLATFKGKCKNQGTSEHCDYRAKAKIKGHCTDPQFAWLIDGVQVDTGKRLAYSMPAGEHVVELLVSDGGRVGRSATVVVVD